MTALQENRMPPRSLAVASVRRHDKLALWRHEELAPSELEEGLDDHADDGDASADRGSAEGRDAGAGRRVGDAEAEGAWLGRTSDRGGARVLADDGSAMAAGGGVAPPAVALAPEGAGRPGGMGRGAVPPSRRQRRCGSPGARGREGCRGEPAHGRAGGGASAPGAARRGAGDGALRDAAWSAAADRLRPAAGRDRRRPAAGVRSSSRRSATHAASTSAPFSASARSTGSREWKAPSRRSAACRRKCCSTMPER